MKVRRKSEKKSNSKSLEKRSNSKKHDVKFFLDC